MSVSRPVRRPSADFDRLELPVWQRPLGVAWRVHAHRQSALHFGRNAGHRFSPLATPLPVLYLGESLATCLWERFGDDILNPGAPVARSLWLTRSVSQLELPSLRICDLTNEVTRGRARVDLSALNHPDLEIPQAWGLALQHHPAEFDGLRYASRFNGCGCLALFDRHGLATRIRVIQVDELSLLPEGELFLREREIALI